MSKVIVDFTTEEKKLFKKHFGKYGTQQAFQKETGVHSSTIRRIKHTYQATREVKEKVINYLNQLQAA